MAVQDVNRQTMKEVVENNQIVIVDFWAEWCGPCKRFSPIFESVAAKHADIKFVKVNTDIEQELAAMFEVRSIPTIAVIKEQDIVFVQPGAFPEEVLEEVVQKARDLDMEQVRKDNPR
ncbi:MAG TPA: thioredoxin [Bdellovibrio sp.]|uniref:thioredoxin n=1 Tax=Bdellovibrio sp. TaxID=28201 RepID=UPI002EFF6CCA